MNPNNWFTVFYFCLIATLFSVSYGWLVKGKKGAVQSRVTLWRKISNLIEQMFSSTVLGAVKCLILLNKEVLYYLPVTQKWIFQLILALILICHCSYRGVIELLRDLFDYSLSIGTIHNRVMEAVQKAQKINQAQDLSSIEVALLDEIFQSNRPVLTGVDAHSTHCFLLESVEHRDENTWGWHLLEAESQGLNPDYTIKEAVESAMKSTPRASSLVENLNSRLRNYFFLRKHLNSDYLDLLRFFLNHRTFRSSRVTERKGKSPTELMRKKHPHWLSLLGFDLFQRV